MTRRRSTGPDDRGSFTAELAAGLPALVLLLLVGLTVVEAVATRAQCLDAAREAALAASRGDNPDRALTEIGPRGATMSTTVDDGRIRVTVEAPVRALGAQVPRGRVTASAIAAVEPGTPVTVP